MQVKRVEGHVVAADVVPDVVRRPFDERVDLHHTETLVDLGPRAIGAIRGLIAADRRDPRIEIRSAPLRAEGLSGAGSTRPALSLPERLAELSSLLIDTHARSDARES